MLGTADKVGIFPSFASGKITKKLVVSTPASKVTVSGMIKISSALITFKGTVAASSEFCLDIITLTWVGSVDSNSTTSVTLLFVKNTFWQSAETVGDDSLSMISSQDVKKHQ